MKTIHIKHPHHGFNLPKLVMALGFFDGVHKGHQEVILKAKEEAEERGLKSGVMTFNPHPKEVLRKGAKVQYLTNLEEKEALIEQLNVDYLFIVEFNQLFAELTPQQFVDQYLIGLNVHHVVAGFDYTYGRLGKGRMETLPFHSRNKLTYTIVGKVEAAGEKISSTNIRIALSEGNITKVNEYLGRYYISKGKVVGGEQRGREIGFPTANVQLEEGSIIPGLGVYVVRIFVDNSWYEGVCNVGFKPTFHNEHEGSPTIEVHIFNFQQNIYGKKVKVEWCEKLRSEKKFESVHALIDQLNEDARRAKEFFHEKKEKSTSICNNS